MRLATAQSQPTSANLTKDQTAVKNMALRPLRHPDGAITLPQDRIRLACRVWLQMDVIALQLVEQQLVIHLLEVVLVLLHRAHQQAGQRLLLSPGRIGSNKQSELVQLGQGVRAVATDVDKIELLGGG